MRPKPCLSSPSCFPIDIYTNHTYLPSYTLLLLYMPECCPGVFWHRIRVTGWWNGEKASIGENAKIKILICPLLLVIRLLNLLWKVGWGLPRGVLVFLVFLASLFLVSLGKISLSHFNSCHCIIKCCLLLLAAHGLPPGYACFLLCLQFLWSVDTW